VSMGGFKIKKRRRGAELGQLDRVGDTTSTHTQGEGVQNKKKEEGRRVRAARPGG
jgi:hypothetical protein